MNVIKQPTISVLIVAGTLFFSSCKKDGPPGPKGDAGLKSLLDIQPLPPDENCSTGGLVIKTGIDKNGNNKLDSVEVENKQYIYAMATMLLLTKKLY